MDNASSPSRGGEEVKKYRFVTIRRNGEECFEGQPVYRVYSNKSGKHLAIISFYKPWKQYVFNSNEECVFNNMCLRDILDFMENHSEIKPAESTDAEGKK